MPTRHMARRSNRRSNRRKLVWCVTDQVIANTAAGNVTNIDLLSDLKVAGSSVLGSTVMRTHLQLSVFTTVTIGDSFHFGLIIDQSDELVNNTANTGLLLDPERVHEADWMWWEHAVAAPTFSTGGSNVLIRDVKSKRRLEELNQTYILSLRGDVTSVAPQVQVVARTLLALP